MTALPINYNAYSNSNEKIVCINQNELRDNHQRGINVS